MPRPRRTRITKRTPAVQPKNRPTHETLEMEKGSQPESALRQGREKKDEIEVRFVEVDHDDPQELSMQMDDALRAYLRVVVRRWLKEKRDGTVNDPGRPLSGMECPRPELHPGNLA